MASSIGGIGEQGQGERKSKKGKDRVELHFFFYLLV